MFTKTVFAMSVALLLSGTSGAHAYVDAEAQLVTSPTYTGAHAAFAQAPTVPDLNQNGFSSVDWSIDAEAQLVN